MKKTLKQFIVPTKDFDSNIQYSLDYILDSLGDTIIPVFDNGDFSTISLKDVVDCENQTFHNILQTLIEPPHLLYQICSLAYRLMLYTESLSGIIPEILKPILIKLYKMAREVNIKQLLFDCKSRFDKNINSLYIDLKINDYIQLVPKTKRIEFYIKNDSYISTLYCNDYEEFEKSRINKLNKDVELVSIIY